MTTRKQREEGSITTTETRYKRLKSSNGIVECLKQAQFLQSRNKVSAISLYDEILEMYPQNIDALVQKGLCYVSLGLLEDALSCVLDALKLNPTDASALNAIGLVYKSANKLQLAIKYFKQAVRADPNSLSAKQNLCVALTDCGTLDKNSGNLQRGLKYYHKALKYVENYALTYFNIAVIFTEKGEYEEALSYYFKVIKINPHFFEAYSNIGDIYKKQGKIKEAIEYYQQAYHINPNIDIIKMNLSEVYAEWGTQIKNLGNIKECIALYKKSLYYNHKYWNAYYNLGVIYGELGKTERAIINYKLAIEFNSQCIMAYHNLGVLEKKNGNWEKAIEYYKMVLDINPKIPYTLSNLGFTYLMMGNIEDASVYFKKAIAEDPYFIEAYNNIGIMYRDEAEIDLSLRFHKYCITLDPNTRNAGHNFLLALNYKSDTDEDEIFHHHENWGKQFRTLFEAYTSHDNDPNPDKKITIGYISPDFFVHSVSYFIEVMLKQYDKEKYTTICYSNVSRPDYKTAKFKSYVDVWRPIESLDTKTVAEQIRADGVDILIELSGHTAGNRLDVMALKPAPIQVTWIGYPNTTGLDIIDYRFTDALVDPVNSTQKFTEKLIRLPQCFLCYTPIDDPPPISTPPCLSNGYITFGSFNNIAKMTKTVFDTWSKIMLQVPQSRFVIKSKSFASEKVKNKIWGIFQKNGIDASRIDLIRILPNTHDHLTSYSLMDFSLDTFPYAGTTTTCEALFMGVPVITLQGNNCHAASVGVSLLSQIEDQEQFIAKNLDEYVNKATDLANNVSVIQELRQSLRQKMMASYLCNATLYTKNIEETYQKVWKKWCKKQKQAENK